MKTGSLDLGADLIATPGDVISYSFTVSNTGNVTPSNVTVTDPGITAAGGPLLILAVGASDNTTFSGTYAISQADIDAGVKDNTATTNGTAPDGAGISDTDSHSEPIPQAPAIDLVKSFASNADEDGSGDIRLGDTLTFSCTVTNTDNVTLNNVTVSDPEATVTGGPIASMAPGASDSTTFSATYVVTAADVTAGLAVNTATTSGEASGEASGGDPVDPTDSADLQSISKVFFQMPGDPGTCCISSRIRSLRGSMFCWRVHSSVWDAPSCSNS